MMKKVIDYLLSNDLAEIPKRGRNELKTIVIGNEKFRYNKKTRIKCFNKETIISKENQ